MPIFREALLAGIAIGEEFTLAELTIRFKAPLETVSELLSRKSDHFEYMQAGYYCRIK